MWQLFERRGGGEGSRHNHFQSRLELLAPYPCGSRNALNYGGYALCLVEGAAVVPLQTKHFYNNYRERIARKV